jgi:hypothetical protein
MTPQDVQAARGSLGNPVDAGDPVEAVELGETICG